MKIYAASSWRNMLQPGIVAKLREEGHEVYDFRNPPNGTGFAWSEIDPGWQGWSRTEYLEALNTQRAQEGFNSDMDAMKWADAGVLVLGAGASAHLELGWFSGSPGKYSIILLQPDYDDDAAIKYLKNLGHSMGHNPCSVCGTPVSCQLDSRLGDSRYEDRMKAVRMTPFEPELMYLMADVICTTVDLVLTSLEAFEEEDHAP